MKILHLWKEKNFSKMSENIESTKINLQNFSTKFCSYSTFRNVLKTIKNKTEKTFSLLGCVKLKDLHRLGLTWTDLLRTEDRADFEICGMKFSTSWFCVGNQKIEMFLTYDGHLGGFGGHFGHFLDHFGEPIQNKGVFC